MFTTTPRFLRFIQQDPLRLTHATARFFLETRKLDNHVDELMPGNRLPVQVFLAGEDRIIDNEGVLRVLQSGVQGELEVVVYEDQTHSVQFDAPERLTRDMSRWVARQTASRRSDSLQAR